MEQQDIRNNYRLDSMNKFKFVEIFNFQDNEISKSQFDKTIIFQFNTL